MALSALQPGPCFWGLPSRPKFPWRNTRQRRLLCSITQEAISSMRRNTTVLCHHLHMAIAAVHGMLFACVAQTLSLPTDWDRYVPIRSHQQQQQDHLNAAVHPPKTVGLVTEVEKAACSRRIPILTSNSEHVRHSGYHACLS